MAKKTQVVLISDISGDEITDGGQSIDFAYKGQTYTIDLTDKEADKFDKAMSVYLESATRTGGRSTSRSRGRGAGGGSEDLAAMREWARANGYEVSSRGRISAEVREAYRAAHE